MSSLSYIEKIQKLINDIKVTQNVKIQEAAKVFAEKIKQDRIIHVFGTGHSHMIAEEMFVRAGGLAHVNSILDDSVTLSSGARRSGQIEKITGLANIIWDNYDISPEDVMIIISNSGRNNVPIEMALKAKEEGLFLIAITSLSHSKNCESRHSTGKRLFEIADLIIDNCVPSGDSLVEFGNVKSGPASTIAGATIVNSIVAQTLKILSDRKQKLPIYVSQNVDGYNNDDIFKRFEKRIKHL